MRARYHGLDRSVRNTEPTHSIHAKVRPDDAPEMPRHHGAGPRDVPNGPRSAAAHDLLKVRVVGDVGRRLHRRHGAKRLDHGGRLVPPARELDRSDHEANVYGVPERPKVEHGLRVAVRRVQVDGATAHALGTDGREPRRPVEGDLDDGVVIAFYGV